MEGTKIEGTILIDPGLPPGIHWTWADTSLVAGAHLGVDDAGEIVYAADRRDGVEWYWWAGQGTFVYDPASGAVGRWL